MVVNVRFARAPITNLLSDEPGQLDIGHGWMSTQRNHVVENFCFSAERLFDRTKHQRHRHGARPVGNQHQNTLSIKTCRVKGLCNECPDLRLGQEAFEISFASQNISDATVGAEPSVHRDDRTSDERGSG